MPARRVHSERFLRFAWVAAQFHGLPGREIPGFVEHTLHAERVSLATIDAAVQAVRGNHGRKLRPNGEAATPRSASAAIWSDWLRLDEARLGLRKALIRIPNDGMPVENLVAALRGISGLRQIIVTAEDREVLAIAIFRTEDEGKELRARIEEHVGPGQRVRMHGVFEEYDDPTPATWLDIAKREVQS